MDPDQAATSLLRLAGSLPDPTDPSLNAAIMLGYALRGAGRRNEMYEAWRRALSRDKGNVSLRVDIAEHLAADGRMEEGLAWLDEGLALEPDHPKAFPSACYMRFQSDGDIAHLVRLADWWREHSQHGYADKMLALGCYMRPWLGESTRAARSPRALPPLRPAVEGHHELAEQQQC